MLPECDHLCCEECLNELVGKIGRDGWIKCPECRRPTQMKKLGVRHLKTNLKVQNLAEILRSREESVSCLRQQRVKNRLLKKFYRVTMAIRYRLPPVVCQLMTMMLDNVNCAYLFMKKQCTLDFNPAVQRELEAYAQQNFVIDELEFFLKFTIFFSIIWLGLLDFVHNIVDWILYISCFLTVCVSVVKGIKLLRQLHYRNKVDFMWRLVAIFVLLCSGLMSAVSFCMCCKLLTFRDVARCFLSGGQD